MGYSPDDTCQLSNKELEDLCASFSRVVVSLQAHIQQQAVRIRELEADARTLRGALIMTGEQLTETQQQLSEVVEYAKALQLLARAAYPVPTMLDKRGYQWSQTYLDEALARINALPLPKAMQPTQPENKP